MTARCAPPAESIDGELTNGEAASARSAARTATEITTGAVTARSASHADRVDQMLIHGQVVNVRPAGGPGRLVTLGRAANVWCVARHKTKTTTGVGDATTRSVQTAGIPDQILIPGQVANVRYAPKPKIKTTTGAGIAKGASSAAMLVPARTTGVANKAVTDAPGVENYVLTLVAESRSNWFPYTLEHSLWVAKIPSAQMSPRSGLNTRSRSAAISILANT